MMNKKEFYQKLICDKEFKSQLKKRSKDFITTTVDKRLVKYNELDKSVIYNNSLWEVVNDKKKLIKLKQNKTHWKAFEDRVWSMFAKMGFVYLNRYIIKLPYTRNVTLPGKQIDVFASDNETIIVVECKSSETGKKGFFSKELNEKEKIISGGNRVLKRIFSNKHKICHIFATNNIILSKNDRDRLKELGMIHFDQNDIFYYEQLIGNMGQASKYQLLAKLFENQEITALENKIPAVKGKMGEFIYYSFSLDPHTLLKISFILHRLNVNNEDRGYQRLVSKKRLGQIKGFINEGGFFPNSIILNINSKNNGPLKFDRVRKPTNNQITELGILHLPKKYHSAFIIDGQHRLYGYANTPIKKIDSIPVVAFENLPAEKQIDLFVQINSKQKPVSKNLLTTIIADLMWNSKITEEALEAFMAKLLIELGRKNDNPLYSRIIVADSKKSSITCLTLDTIINYGFKKSMLFAKVSNKKLIKIGFLYLDPTKKDGSFDYQEMLDRSYLFLKTYFNFIKSKTSSNWNLGSGPGGFVATNIGVVCFIRIASEFLEFMRDSQQEDFTNKNGKEIAEIMFNYLEPVFEYINSFTTNKANQFRKYGSNPTGVETGVREFQCEINKQFENFIPNGLKKWIKENQGKLNEVADKAVKIIEIGIKEKVFAVLKELYKADWWTDGVSAQIQTDAACKRIASKKKGIQDWDFLNLINYKKIIHDDWKKFEKIFADPSIKQGKEAQLKWFDTLNEIRNQVQHLRGVVTEDDISNLNRLKEWLSERIEID